MSRWVLFLLGGLLLFPRIAPAQFADSFEGGSVEAWELQTGDGNATMDLRSADGQAVMSVDATADRHNIWWAVMQRDVSAALNLDLLSEPGMEVRVTVRLRVSHAPRRVNLSLHTQHTTNFHRHLMEFDVPDTTRWHTISMTTDGFRAQRGDTVRAQLALFDWGLDRYRAVIDSFAVSVVDTAEVGPDTGTAVPYPLPVRSPDAFEHHAPVTHAGIVHRNYPSHNFSSWHATSDTGSVATWTVTTGQFLVLRWSESVLPSGPVRGPGVLELTRHSVHTADVKPEEFGQVRVVELLNGKAGWTRETITYNRLVQGKSLDEALNPQPIVDVDVLGEAGESVHIPISEPVLRRLLKGKTQGLALRPLGPVSATFFAPGPDRKRYRIRLHLDSAPKRARSDD